MFSQDNDHQTWTNLELKYSYTERVDFIFDIFRKAKLLFYLSLNPWPNTEIHLLIDAPFKSSVSIKSSASFKN